MGYAALWRAEPNGTTVPVACDANGRCRLHGGASPGAARGEGNGMFKHGLRSTEVIKRRREMTAEMRRIRHEVRELGRS